MLWLQRPNWSRWAVAALLIVGSLWVELRPAAMTEHPFATIEIAPGDEIDTSNTEFRLVPVGTFRPIEGSVASRHIAAGDPILDSDVDETNRSVPAGWWSVSTDVPQGARVGDPVQVLVLSSGRSVDGVVTAVEPDDPFVDETGAIAVSPEHVTEVAMAAAEGQIVVLVAAR